MAKSRKPKFELLDPSINPEDLAKVEPGEDALLSPLLKSIINSLESNQKIVRLAFDKDPQAPNKFAGIYYDKVSLLPDSIIKKLSIVDDLLATIIRARANHVSAFGTELQDRFSTGFRIEPNKKGDFDDLSPEKKAEIFKRIAKATKLLKTCGHDSRWDDKEKMSLSTFLYLTATNAVKFGRFATEVIYTTDRKGERICHSFRPSDPGTIYAAIPNSDAIDSVRKQAFQKLQELKNEKLQPEKFLNDEYAWVQVINGSPTQAFTTDEMIVHNCYPVTDIETNGYPITPIDTAIAAITTHINITNHNKLYFQARTCSKRNACYSV